MICPASESHEHLWESPFEGKHIERCQCCVNKWRIHTEDKVVILPPPEALASLSRNHATSIGAVLPFRRRSS